MTLIENVELPMRFAEVERSQREALAMHALERVGLANRKQHRPTELSGGEQQRASLARALINRPKILLADEPTGNLDSGATLEVLRLFESLRNAGLTLVVVTHDERIAATADRLISMRDGAFVDETRLTGGTSGNLADLAGLGS
jgi:putative ABC transport system ATP-binding protein